MAQRTLIQIHLRRPESRSGAGRVQFEGRIKTVTDTETGALVNQKCAYVAFSKV